MKKYYFLPLLFIGLLLFSACEDDDMNDNNGNEEVEADVTITIQNIGASAWQITAVEGADAASIAELNTDNPALTLQEGTRYRFINRGGMSHPLEFRNANGDPLLVQFDEMGSFEGNSMVNYQEDNEGVTFTLTSALNSELASYFCSIHSSMNGSINAPDGPDIVSLASDTDDLSTLVQALSRFDDLVEALGGEGSFTVFAPTNAAFTEFLNSSSFASLDEVPDDVLRSVLTYHVIAENAVASGDITDGLMAETLNGQQLTFTLDGNAVIINGSAEVVQADVSASNGVVHLIDEVLVPAAEPDATITIDNVGASAWVFTAITGEGASASLNTENASLTLTVGNRFRFINEGGSAHPLAFLNSTSASLLSEDGNGSFEQDTEVDFADTDDGIVFTLTPELADEIAAYICTVHASMEGSVSTQQ